MRIEKQFAPITLYIESEEEKRILITILRAAQKEASRYMSRDSDVFERAGNLIQRLQ